jgi:hypothetical protein
MPAYDGMPPDDYDDCVAEEFLRAAPPSRAAKLLDATEDLFILETRDWASEHWQPNVFEWLEED